ncbi:uncharacterized protein C8A04DRAFT_31050 [Dichotomopilus funicola]|uniref:AB hydrolase-1 domain-containing protein n=1 Tax=Dichotomopilus funicola TaxID=1934379 RepID=A0AAN6UYL8_9PEZI|nr:hypothetical protein C8A04DRAFT_31050 [Dichotomopilus funicola]
MEDLRITLDTKPGASLHASILRPAGDDHKGNPLSNTLIVFLNGLALPSAGWSGVIERLIALHKEHGQPVPTLFSYDRYGQGKSDPDPSDKESDLPYGHDARSVVADLHQLLTQVVQSELSHRPQNDGGEQEADLRLVLVCNSIGCPLARLFAAEQHSRRQKQQPSFHIAAYLFLDSMIANTDFVSLFPDPDSEDFGNETDLPSGVTLTDLRHARAQFRRFFHPTVPNQERFDRRGMRQLLPDADQPPLPSYAGAGGESLPPLLTVVGHDWDEFARQSEQPPFTVSSAITNSYMNTAWGAYNEGLTRLVPVTSQGSPQEVKIAKGCGHFVQKDDPGFVAAEINGILDALVSRGQ